MSALVSVTVEVTALDAECVASTLVKLALAIQERPEAAEWEVSDIEGSAVAERNRDEEV